MKRKVGRPRGSGPAQLIRAVLTEEVYCAVKELKKRGLKEHETRPLLEQLSALGWLERVDPPRPSLPPHWRVNPAVHEEFTDRAVREAERREATRNMISKLSRK